MCTRCHGRKGKQQTKTNTKRRTATPIDWLRGSCLFFSSPELFVDHFHYECFVLLYNTRLFSISISQTDRTLTGNDDDFLRPMITGEYCTVQYTPCQCCTVNNTSFKPPRSVYCMVARATIDITKYRMSTSSNASFIHTRTRTPYEYGMRCRWLKKLD